MELQKYVVTRMNKKTGEITVEAVNFTGESCIERTMFIKKAIGHTTTRVLKTEYYEEEAETVFQHIPICG